MTATRTDIHRWSVADPGEYREVAYGDNHPEDGGIWTVEAAPGSTPFIGNYDLRSRCDHCGSGPLRYFAVFLHVPTNTTIVTGMQCAERMSMTSRSELEIRQHVEQVRRDAKLAAWKAAKPEHEQLYWWLVETVEEKHNYGYGGFFHSLLHKARRYGELTERQVEAGLRAMEREASFQARREAEAAAIDGPLVEGKREISGEIVSTKVVDGYAGDSIVKMLVREATGTKVWGTVPQTLFTQVYEANPTVEESGMKLLVGCQVTFTATVERSRDDEHFGFFKRPTKARLT